MMNHSISYSHIKKKEHLLTVIIPVRVSSNRIDILERLNYPLIDKEIPDDVNFLVVDDGSSIEYSEQLKTKCIGLGFDYIHIDSELKPWCLPRARNIGAMYSNSEYILFQDVDLLPYCGFYKDVINEIYTQELDVYIDNFLMIGVIYLNEQLSEDYIVNSSTPHIKNKYLQKLYNGDLGIEKFSTGTSVNVFNREYFLIRGGNDEDFIQWGYEDIEFMTRCIRMNKKFPLPEEFGRDISNFSNITEYKGWKSIYRLFGDMTFMKGIVMFHASHPVDTNSDYQQHKHENRKLFEKKQLQFARDGIEPDALPDLSKGIKTLIFRNNPYVFSREIRPRLGEIYHVDEAAFDSSDDIFSFIESEKITQVLFHNPYSNNRMIDIYNKCRQRNLTYYVAERGGLRGSFFYDPNGFLSDSSSYSNTNWDIDITDSEKSKTIEFIQKEISATDALEKQGDRVGPVALKKKLKIKSKHKVIFVPLQRPSDSVITYHCGDIGSYDNFINLINELSDKLPHMWSIVVKKHPLEDETPIFSEQIIIADEQTHVNDLIELADHVLLINSGVGLLSMMYMKSTIYTGNTYYGHAGLNNKATTANEVIEIINSNFRPEKEKVVKFINYLINYVYSFGEFKNREVRLDNGQGPRITATVGITFNTLRGLGGNELCFSNRKKPHIKFESSILFDRYKYAKTIKIPSTTSITTNHKPVSPAQPNNKDISFLGKMKKKINKFRNRRDDFFRDSQKPLVKALSK
ncbi:glycosyltransferase [Aeromonas veronii]|uniref:glycosyltransferase n=1 Tax=Aeromonas veronii TaxID=654 RepID=UPI003D241199